MSGNQHSWLQADDDIVRQKLGSALKHAQSDITPAEILGSPPPGQYRQAFLRITKTYHPNRFARRPEDIRRLANDVYILLKEAFEEAQTAQAILDQEATVKKAKDAKAGEAQAAARAAINTARDPNSGVKSGKAALPDPAVLATRRAMKERRHKEMQKKALGGTGRTAQVRAATDAKPARSEAATLAEETKRFDRAVNQMRITDFTTAAATFKELAIGRPSEKRYRMHMHYAQGRVQQAMGNNEEARAEYKRALGLDANFAEAHQAMETLPGGHKDKAKKLLKKFFKS